jgi:hypothetical protein
MPTQKLSRVLIAALIIPWRFERPGLDKGVISQSEDFTPVTLGAGALLDIGDVSSGHFPNRQDVVWVRVISMIH